MAALEDQGHTEENNVPYLKQPKYCFRCGSSSDGSLPFSSFLISFMMITDINNAIVAMVKLPTPSTNQNSTQDNPLVCYDHSLNSTFTNVYVCSHHEGGGGDVDSEVRDQGSIWLLPAGHCHVLSSSLKLPPPSYLCLTVTY
ncbi:hypothetical protein J6590_062981 [Homalodisca vitripennis]|nr:hypothetical protein J6590_062981 [Homalodisca vitripennis]